MGYIGNYAKRNTITSNVCHDNADYGILEVDSTDGAERNAIVGNVCYHNGPSPSYDLHIHLGEGTNSTLEHNQTA